MTENPTSTQSHRGHRDRLPAIVKWASYGLIAIVVLFVVVESLAFLVDHMKYRSLLRKAGEIEIGDSREKVLEKLGDPISGWDKGSKIFPSPEYEFETWTYGKILSLEGSFDSEPPYFYPVFLWPVRWRWGIYQSDDVRLEFDSDGKVARITMPGQSGE